MKRLVFCGFLLTLCASPVQSQIRIGRTLNDSLGYGFTVDTISHRKFDPSKPWVWEVVPKPLVKQWWFDQAKCQGLTVPDGFFEQLRFFMVNDYWFYEGVVGFAVIQEKSIYLAYPFAGDKRLASHEMLHFILLLNGIPVGHPMPYFSRCGVSVTYPP